MTSKIVIVCVNILTVGSAAVTLYEFATKGTIPNAAILAICLFFGLFLGSLIYLFVQDYRLGRKGRYAEALGEIGQLYQKIQELSLKSQSIAAHDIRRECEAMMDGLTRIFDMVTSTKTGACIKLIQHLQRKDTGILDTIAVPLCRDSLSRKLRVEEDKREHWLNENTGFQNVWVNRGNPFFCNDLPAYAGYKNTSANGVGSWSVPPRRFVAIRRWFFWPLKYRSTMIVAIVSPEGNPGKRIHGFLCVDSRSRGVFDERYGIDILTGFSQVISPIIARYHELAPTQLQP
jgi:hypothetical protein